MSVQIFWIFLLTSVRLAGSSLAHLHYLSSNGILSICCMSYRVLRSSAIPSLALTTFTVLVIVLLSNILRTTSISALTYAALVSNYFCVPMSASEYAEALYALSPKSERENEHWMSSQNVIAVAILLWIIDFEVDFEVVYILYYF